MPAWDGAEFVEKYRERVDAKGEPLFVKNLENVQGDERDHIFISMTYGKKHGEPSLSQNFGPINRKQGHRRLNVLFTRARVRIGLFAFLRIRGRARGGEELGRGEGAQGLSRIRRDEPPSSGLL